jgi:hypothetical protein
MAVTVGLALILLGVVVALAQVPWAARSPPAAFSP